MKIITFGGGGRVEECARILADRLPLDESARAIILPIPSARDKRYITGTDLPISDIFPLLAPSTLVVGYSIPEQIAVRAEQASAVVYDAALDEDFLLANAELTARGAVGYILTHSVRDISEMTFGVVGYGRIGMRLIRLLLLLGGKITLFTRSIKTATEVGEMGICARVLDGNCDIGGVDMLINTAPARLIDIDMLDPETEIIELASGNNFDPSDRITRLMSIPDRYYPRTAGRLYAEGALRRLGGRL